MISVALLVLAVTKSDSDSENENGMYCMHGSVRCDTFCDHVVFFRYRIVKRLHLTIQQCQVKSRQVKSNWLSLCVYVYVYVYV